MAAGRTGLVGPALTAALATLAGVLAFASPPAGAVVTAARGIDPGTQVVIGDWDGDGTDTPGLVTGRHWELYPDPWLNGAPVVFAYGKTSDQPVVGDWDGDGTDTPGVRRGNRWLLRNRLQGGVADVDLAYGKPSDRPVVGDWTGDGHDTPGVRRGNIWFLKAELAGGVADWTFSYGRGTDSPVAGDWDGDGDDTPGVRRAATWFLNNGLKSGAADHQLDFGAPADSPVVGDWTDRGRTDVGVEAGGVFRLRNGSPAGGTLEAFIGACPTASVYPGPDGAAAALVVTPDHLDHPAPALDATGQNVTAAYGNAVRYLLGAHYDEVYADTAAVGYLELRGDQPGYAAAEHALRPPGLDASSVAIAVRTGAFDLAATGRPREFAVDHASQLLRSVACEHRASTPGGWPTGDDIDIDLIRTSRGWRNVMKFQSAHWAYLSGLAGWLLWEDLDPFARTYVARMVEWEANRVADKMPNVWRADDGLVLQPGDSELEEMTWDANVVTLAALMMPDHPRAAQWRWSAVKHVLTATASISDATGSTVVGGFPIGDWADGSNIYDDGTLDNHRNHAHPDYMSSVYQAWVGALLTPLRDEPAPRAYLWNGELIYGALSTVEFVPGEQHDLDPSAPGTNLAAPYHAPGGTIYVPGGPDIYYPNPSVWGSVGRARFVNIDVLASVLGLDGGASWPAWEAAGAHVQGTLANQARFPDGRSFSGPEEFNYPGREEFNAHMLANAYLGLYIDGRVGFQFTDDGPGLWAP